jgi:hypothetical protein
MTDQQLDQQRADFMDALYRSSGRTCGTYTGLWEEFCRDIAANFRDTDYAELHAKVCMAMDECQSVFTHKQAQQAIQVCRAELLGKWA